MLLYTIMPLDLQHIDEICADIERQYRDGIASCALFMVKIVPEGKIPVNKAKEQCAVYDCFRDKLKEKGLPCGILVQCTIGHGYALAEYSDFQRYTNLTDGTVTNTYCPYDENIRAYFKAQFSEIARHKPDVIMVDDDFRLLGRPGQGCACPLHVEAFNRKTGEHFDRSMILDKVSGKNRIEACRDAFVETQRESLVDAAKMMREGIDEVDPSIPGVFCAVGDCFEFAAEIAAVLAGKGNPVVVRVNNGNYTPEGARNVTNSMRRAASQKCVGGKDVDIYLAETDTCPQNRYSTSAMSLHTHFTGSILEGMNGAKHWITRLAAFEPASGEYYRKVLGRYSGFYNALADLVKDAEWLGCRIPISSVPKYAIDGIGTSSKDCWDGWSLCVLERLGLPMYFSDKAGGAAFLAGAAYKMFSDKELSGMLSGVTFIDGDCAKGLCDRGYSEFLGVDVRDHLADDKPVCGEYLPTEERKCASQHMEKVIVPKSENVRADSYCYFAIGASKPEMLYPAVSVYDNPYGGRAHVFCGRTRTSFKYTEAFSFLNESRKKQLVRLLKESGALPVYYPGDAEVYLRAAKLPDGSMLCSFINIGLDPMDTVELVAERNVSSVEMLTPDGKREKCGFSREGDRLAVDTPAYTLQPVILFLK